MYGTRDTTGCSHRPISSIFPFCRTITHFHCQRCSCKFTRKFLHSTVLDAFTQSALHFIASWYGRLSARRMYAHSLFLRRFFAWVAFNHCFWGHSRRYDIYCHLLFYTRSPNRHTRTQQSFAYFCLRKHSQTNKTFEYLCIRQTNHHEFCVQLRLVLS